ncbi:TIGR03086 family metal-binding protein [Streptomyces sp. NPDC048172]|uniref:TIGR03086 family metal-binding protein n=1 Tax=Streptomyces sp. NPDC048172 TaxID=3365505 RepID=UPI00371936BF
MNETSAGTGRATDEQGRWDQQDRRDQQDQQDPRLRLARATERFGALVARVRPEQLGGPTPCAEFDVRALVGHMVGVARRIAHVGEGGSYADAPPWAEDVRDDDWARAFEEARERIRAAWADDAKLAETVGVPWGTAPGGAALGGWTMEVVTHTWDLARALDLDGELDETDGVNAELGAFALELAAMVPREARGGPVPFGEVREAPEGADAHTRLAAWMGRDPEWRPARGPVLTAVDEGYDEERKGFQAGDAHRPDRLVVAETAQDVQEAVAYARERGLPVAVQATGHGLSRAARDGVLVSTRRMTGIRVDPDARTVWVEAGVRAGDLVAEAARHGLAPVNGSFPGVGVVSYALGGGVGILGRRFGYATDQVRRVDVVTADGRLRTVTAESDPELFRGLRGGAAHLGVVTGLELELVPVERIYGGMLVFDGGGAGAAAGAGADTGSGGTGAAEDVVNAWREWTETVPEEMASAVSLLPMPDVPGAPDALRGRYLAQLHFAFTGTPEEGERLIAPLRETGPVLVDTVREMPYTESSSVFSEPGAPHAYRGVNALVGEGGIGPAEVRSLLKRTGPEAPVMCVVGIRHMGGALAREPEVPDTVGHRGAAYLVGVLSPLDGTGEDTVRGLHAQALEAVGPGTVGRRLNFLYGQHDAETVRAAYEPEDLARLRALKESLDPSDMFRFTPGPGLPSDGGRP